MLVLVVRVMAVLMGVLDGFMRVPVFVCLRQMPPNA